MQYVLLVLFVLGGAGLMFAARYINHYGPRSPRVRLTLAVICNIVGGEMTIISLAWWQAVILGKGWLWTLYHNFGPVQLLLCIGGLLAAQYSIARGIFWLLKRSKRKTLPKDPPK